MWTSSGGLRKCVAVSLCAAFTVTGAFAQQPSIEAEKPNGSVIIRPYRPVIVPPIRLYNSTRLVDLIRGGKLYLTVQDAIALALENNIDIETDRYNPLIDTWNLERSQAGGALPGVPSGSSQAGTVVSGEGVAGSQAAAGVSTGGNGGAATNAVGATISQIGPVTPTLDPIIQSVNTFSHRSSPQPISLQSGVSNLVQNTRNYSETISQGLLSGGQVSLSYRDSYLNENATTDLLNPESATVGQLSIRNNLLQGFGTALNGRNITVARANVKIDALTFEDEVTGVVGNVLNLYYGLVADYEDVRAKQQAFDVAARFFEDNKKQVQIGTMAPLDVTTAESQVASSQQDLVISQTALQEQQISLKNVLSRNGLADPLIANVEIIPLDRIVVPEKDDTPPMKELIATAVRNRPDLKGSQMNLQNLETSALGTANAVLPQLAVTANASSQGLTGTPQAVVLRTQAQTQSGPSPIPPGFVICPPGKAPPGSVCEVPDPYFVGGIGNALGQTIRRNFPSETAGGFLAATLRNRQAQADQAIDQLSLRQAQLQTRKDLNQVAVDVSNQSIGLQQTRVRYLAAVRNRVLEEQLLQAEQRKFALGASTTYNVVQQQRDLAAAQSAEVGALVSYSNARVALDQTLGTTLETNHVALNQAVNGSVARRSALPEKLPERP